MENQVEKKDFQLTLSKKKRSNMRNFLIKLSFVVVIYGLLLGYCFTPLSQVKSPLISGNIYYQKDEIMEIGHIKSDEFLYRIETKSIANKLNEFPLIKDGSAQVHADFFNLRISYREVVPALKHQEAIYSNYYEVIDASLFMDTNPLIGQFLNTHSQNIPEFNGDNLPEDKTRAMQNMTGIIGSLSDEVKEILKYVGFRENHANNIAFYFLYRDNYVRITLYSLDNDFKTIIKSYLTVKTIKTIYEAISLSNSDAIVTTTDQIMGEEKVVYPATCGEIYQGNAENFIPACVQSEE